MEEIVLKFSCTEEKAAWLEDIMDEYGQDLLQLVYSYVKNHAVAEELTQDIFVKCYQKIDTYKQQSSLKTWIWRIAMNHCKDYLRSWYNRKMILSEKLSTQAFTPKEVVEMVIIQKTEEERLSEAVLALPIKYRELIYLHYFEELTILEIEQLLVVNANTIKTRLRKAKQLLKRELGDELDGI